ncbi:MAG: hypothetical protein IJ091_01805 [Oscillospiraceae bacterium]|nr:hypothetical protein [Oscillospiraceae bacterium]
MAGSKFCKDCVNYNEEPDPQDGVTERLCTRDGWQTAPFLSCPWHQANDKNAERIREKTKDVSDAVLEELRFI